jgi:acyl-ACP thioesterase
MVTSDDWASRPSPTYLAAVPEPPAVRLEPWSGVGRRYTARRLVRVANASPNGRLRLDAIADMAQDIAGDDSRDAAVGDDSSAWVVRRTLIEVTRPAVYGEELELATWCSGVGRRWAERRTSFRGDRGGVADVASLWVHIDRRTGRATRLPQGFDDAWASGAAGREVSSRFQHEPDVPQSRASAAGRSLAVSTMTWTTRFADFDVLGHVNNASTWAMVEQAIADGDGPRPPHRAELEYRLPIERDDTVVVTTEQVDGTLRLWVHDGGRRAAEARLFATAVVLPLG